MSLPAALVQNHQSNPKICLQLQKISSLHRTSRWLARGPQVCSHWHLPLGAGPRSRVRTSLRIMLCSLDTVQCIQQSPYSLSSSVPWQMGPVPWQKNSRGFYLSDQSQKSLLIQGKSPTMEIRSFQDDISPKQEPPSYILQPQSFQKSIIKRMNYLTGGLRWGKAPSGKN